MTSPGEEMIARARKIAADLVAPGHRQPINPKANYRTRDVALFEEASAMLLSLSALREGGGGEDGSSGAGAVSSQAGSDPIGGAPLDLGLAAPYRPVAIHFEEPDTLEFVERDVATISRPIYAGLDQLLDVQGREPIGWRIYGWSRIAPALSGFAGSDTTEQSDLAREASGNQSSKGPATNDGRKPQ